MYVCVLTSVCFRIWWHVTLPQGITWLNLCSYFTYTTERSLASLIILTENLVILFYCNLRPEQQRTVAPMWAVSPSTLYSTVPDDSLSASHRRHHVNHLISMTLNSLASNWMVMCLNIVIGQICRLQDTATGKYQREQRATSCVLTLCGLWTMPSLLHRWQPIYYTRGLSEEIENLLRVVRVGILPRHLHRDAAQMVRRRRSWRVQVMCRDVISWIGCLYVCILAIRAVTR